MANGKIIIINDMDGHTTAAEFNANNLRLVLQWCLDSDFIDQIDDPNKALELAYGAEDTETLSDWMEKHVHCINSRHCHICITDIEKQFSKHWNPLC